MVLTNFSNFLSIYLAHLQLATLSAFCNWKSNSRYSLSYAEFSFVVDFLQLSGHLAYDEHIKVTHLLTTTRAPKCSIRSAWISDLMISAHSVFCCPCLLVYIAFPLIQCHSPLCRFMLSNDDCNNAEQQFILCWLNIQPWILRIYSAINVNNTTLPFVWLRCKDFLFEWINNLINRVVFVINWTQQIEL